MTATTVVTMERVAGVIPMSRLMAVVAGKAGMVARMGTSKAPRQRHDGRSHVAIANVPLPPHYSRNQMGTAPAARRQSAVRRILFVAGHLPLRVGMAGWEES